MKTYSRLTFLSLFLLTPFLSNAAAYIKFDGIEGESKDKEHKGWIDISSVSTRAGNHEKWTDLQSFTQVVPRDAASGMATGKRDQASGQATGKRDAASGLATGKRDAASGLPTGKRQHKPIKISKPIDKATPLLAKAMNTGNSIGDVTIQRVQNGKPETMVLLNATVTAIDKSASSEEVTFNYEKIEVRGWDPSTKQPILKANEKATQSKAKNKL